VKRGLVEAAAPHRDVYEARLERLREYLRAAGAQVALIYGDVYRSDDIAHLTNLAIYWNEGVVAVPVDGPPVFLAKLSKRVHPWMERTSILTDLRASQKLPELIGSYFEELAPGTVGFIDRAWWPADLVDGVTAAAPGRDFVDLPDAVRRERLVPDELDRADLERAGSLVAAGLAAAAAAATGDVADQLAALELAARGGGARDVLASCRESAAGVQVDCTVQFANVWARGARVEGDRSGLQDALEAGAEALHAGARLADVQAVLGPDVSVSIVSHCDLATGGDLRGLADAAEPLPESATVTLAVAAGGATVADTYVVRSDGATPITQQTTEVTA
jgi:Creatinase/Prolidase N-terminal domain